MRIFNELKDSIPRNKLKPTRNWKIEQTNKQQNILDLYEDNVKNYKFDAMKTAKNYQHEEIGKILILRNFNNQPLQHLSDGDNGFTFDYDLVEPKARFFFCLIF